MADHRAFMKFYVRDFLADTAELDAAGVGGYMLLIMHYWQHGGLPDDDRALAKIARMSAHNWKNFRTVIEKYFQPGWRHKRIDRELQLADAAHEKRSVAGVIGNAKKLAMRTQCDRNATHIQNRYKTTTEYVLKRKKDANRGSKQEKNGEGSDAPLEPSPELREQIERKGWKQ